MLVKQKAAYSPQPQKPFTKGLTKSTGQARTATFLEKSCLFLF